MTKIITDNEVDQINGKVKILTGGCFDVIHTGHIEFLKKSKKLGDTLVILLENDINIAKLKGTNRPLNNQITRANNLSKLSFIDYVILLNMPDSSQYYYNLVKSISPDIIAVTSNDPLIDAKEEQARLVGGKVVVVMKRNRKFSTTKIIENIG